MMKKSKENQTNVKPNNVKSNLTKLYQEGASKELVCVYQILTRQNLISTNDIVQLALTPEFEQDCIECASADSVYRALRKMQECGWIISHMKKGGYVWQLICDD